MSIMCRQYSILVHNSPTWTYVPSSFTYWLPSHLVQHTAEYCAPHFWQTVMLRSFGKILWYWHFGDEESDHWFWLNSSKLLCRFIFLFMKLVLKTYFEMVIQLLDPIFYVNVYAHNEMKVAFIDEHFNYLEVYNLNYVTLCWKSLCNRTYILHENIIWLIARSGQALQLPPAYLIYAVIYQIKV